MTETKKIIHLTETQKKATNIAKNCFVEAGAGSGKTSILVQRYLNILKAQTAPSLSEICAITFTEKASLEMVKRLREALLQEPTQTIADKKWVDDCLSQLDFAPIGTIHSFCKSLLQQYPLEVGLDPNFTVLSPTKTDYIRRLSVQETIHNLAQLNAPELQHFLSHFTLTQCHTMCFKVLEKQELISNWLTESNIPIEDPLSDHTVKSLEVAASLKEIIKSVINTYDTHKSNEQGVDFFDLINKTHHLLTENPTTRQHIQNSYSHIMVDEFQDTDPLQWKIIQSLSKPNDTVTFLVGDLKQSIYAFRGANPYQFEEVQTQFEQTPNADVISLSDNFRTQPAIIDWINPVFETLFKSEDNTHLNYTPLSPKRDQISGKIEFAFYDNAPQISRKDEAAWVAQKIKSLIKDEGFLLHEIALLFRRNKHMDTFSDALTQLGIPTASLKFQEAPEELHQCLNIVKVLCDPTDTPALLGVLKSPLYQLTDNDIYTLYQTTPDKPLLERIQTSSQQTSHPALKKAAKEIPSWLKKLTTHTLTETLTDILTTHIEHYNTTWNLIEEFLKLLKECESHTPIDYTLLLETLTAHITTNKITADNDYQPAKGAVQCLTIHSSKGLEFPVIFIVESHQGFYTGITEQLLISRKYGAGLSIKSDTPKDKNQIRTKIQQELKSHTLSEEKRIFYVACTRARDHLFITGNPHAKSREASFLSLLAPLYKQHEGHLAFPAGNYPLNIIHPTKSPPSKS